MVPMHSLTRLFTILSWKFCFILVHTVYDFALNLQSYKPSGVDSSRAQRVHLQLWDTAGQERFDYSVIFS